MRTSNALVGKKKYKISVGESADPDSKKPSGIDFLGFKIKISSHKGIDHMPLYHYKGTAFPESCIIYR